MTLEVRLLGQFSVTREGRPLELPSRAARMLLAYLVLHSERSVPRDKIAGILWPESSTATARKNLRQALWHLRRVVGDEHLQEDARSLRLTPGRATSDVARLRGDGGWDEPDALATSVESYRGELLPGCYEEWIQAASGPLRAAYDDRMSRLLRMLAERRRWDELRYWSERWIAHGSVPEPAYRALMRAHAGIGDLPGVAAAYRRCCDALWQEIGVSPSGQTRALYRLLMPGDDAPADPSEPAFGSAEPMLPAPSVRFAGSEPVIEQRAVINRPHDEVFASMLDPEHALLWRSNVFQYDVVAGRPGKEGARVEVTRKMGTEIVHLVAEVVEAEPGRWVRSRTVDSPIRVELETRFDDVSGGTLVTHRRRLDLPAGFFAPLALPAVARWYAADLRADVGKLKELLEAR